MSLLINAIRYEGALYLEGKHLFKVSKCPQQTVLSICLIVLPLNINNLSALQNNGYPASNSSIFSFAAVIDRTLIII